MGLFIKNHGTYEGQTVQRNINYANVDGCTAYFIQSGVSIFGSLLTKITDGQGGEESEAEVSEKTQKEIDELQSNIDDKLKSAGVKTVAALNTAITESQNTQKTLTSEISSLDSTINENIPKIASIKNEIQSLEAKITSNAPKDNNDKLIEKIASLKASKAHLEEQNETAIKQKEQKAKELEEAKKKEVELTAISAEVENYQHRIDKLKKTLSDEIKYNVKKETDDLSNFSSALKAFQSNPDEKTAKAVTDAYTGGHKGVQNATAKKAYKLLQKKYPNFFPQDKTK